MRRVDLQVLTLLWPSGGPPRHLVALSLLLVQAMRNGATRTDLILKRMIRDLLGAAPKPSAETQAIRRRKLRGMAARFLFRTAGGPDEARSRGA